MRLVFWNREFKHFVLCRFDKIRLETFMLDPRIVRREMLIGVVDRRLRQIGLDFDEAKKMAELIAEENLTSPMLLAWFDKKLWKHSPAIC